MISAIFGVSHSSTSLMCNAGIIITYKKSVYQRFWFIYTIMEMVYVKKGTNGSCHDVHGTGTGVCPSMRWAGETTEQGLTRLHHIYDDLFDLWCIHLVQSDVY